MNLKKENGSISIFVLVGLLFMTAFLIITYGNISNKSKSVAEQFNVIKGIYSNKDNSEDSAYEDAYTDLRKRNKQTLTASVENSNVIELEKAYNSKLINYRIYGNTSEVKKSILPYEYEQVQYIESTGTQYIDTGVIGKSGLSADIEMMRTGYEGDASFLGSRNLNTRIYLLHAFGGFTYGYGNYIKIGNFKSGIKYNIHTELEVGRQILQVNGQTILSGEATDTINTNLNMYLFAMNDNGQTIYNMSARCYSCKIYENDTLIRDFIPCYRKSDNVVGLYDIVNGVFYENSGTGEFLKSDPINSDSKIMIRSNIDNIPMEYQRVEYLESTGTQYIDTEVMGKSELSADIEIMRTANESDACFLGSRNVNTRIYLLHAFGGFTYGYGNYIRGSSFQSGVKYNIHTELGVGRQILQVGGQTILSGKTTDRINTELNMYLFAMNYDGQVNYNIKARCYSCQIYEGENLIRNFVPCYRKSDDEIGMYDLVTKTFYTNSGTGTFLKGSDVKGSYEIYLNNPIRKVGNYVDYIDYKTQKVYRNVGVINSYNGENITTDWISSTGNLSIGATVYYGLSETIEENVSLPEIEIKEDDVRLEIFSDDIPSKIEIQYIGYTLD